MVLVNGEIKAKRGVYKAFREHLNAASVGIQWRAGDRNQFGNRTRKYGDWLYFQDREMFDVNLQLALAGEFPGFDSEKWK